MNTRRWHEDALAMRPVFIVGAPRSGTSILYRALQAHPSFKPSAGANLHESNAVQLLKQVRRPGDESAQAVRRLSRYLMDDAALRFVATDVAPLRWRRRLVETVARRYRDRPRVWKAAGEHHVVRRYFLEAQQRRGVVRLVEKTPDNLGFIANLQLAFPQAKFFYIARQPLDVLASYWRRYANQPAHPEWANVSVDRFCSLWQNETRSALRVTDENPALMIVRYEDFTLEPEPTMRTVLGFLDEPFDEACLLTEADETVARDRPWTAMVREPLTPRTNAWRDYVEDDVARTVEDRLFETMQLLGYERQAAVPDPA